MVGVQLPDGASLERTEARAREVTTPRAGDAGREQVVAIAGLSVLDNSASSPMPASPTSC